MSMGKKINCIDPKDSDLSISRQCDLLGLPRSSYYRPMVFTFESHKNLELMRVIDKEFLRHPFYGSRKLRDYLNRQGFPVNRKRVQRLMRLMEIESVAPKPNTSRPRKEHKSPEIFNTDQGSQYTGNTFTGALKESGIKISMDGKGRCMDNIFIERLWRSVKYEKIFLEEYETVAELITGLKEYFEFYNFERSHQSFSRKTPAEVYWGEEVAHQMAA